MTQHVEPKVWTEDFVIGNCRAMFSCPRKWSRLLHTANAEIRKCSSCNQNVFRCQNADDLERHVKAGRCVAVFSVELEVPMFLGQMEMDYHAGDKLRW